MKDNIGETTNVLKGIKVNARRNWDGESWILEDTKTRKPLLIGSKEQILERYDQINKIHP